MAAPLLHSLESAGLLVPVEGGDEPLFPAEDLEAIAAGMQLIAAGVPIADLIELGRDYATATDRVASRAVDLFDEHVRERIQSEGGTAEAAGSKLPTAAWDVAAAQGAAQAPAPSWEGPPATPAPPPAYDQPAALPRPDFTT